MDYNKRCLHNRQLINCVECNGSNICEHRRRRHRCKDCKGSSICKHNKQKEYCKICDGSRLCIHSKDSRYCTNCVGTGLCQHKISKYTCRLCCPLGWAKCCIRHLKKHAVNAGYKEPITSPEEIVIMAATAKLCVLCNEALDWSEGHHLHHNHDTGIVEGFAHGFCNLTEGRIMKLSPKGRIFFLKRLFKDS